MVKWLHKLYLAVLVMQNYELVSEWGSIYKNGDKAIKIYSPDTPYDYVMEKARIHSLIYDAGLPVPAVYGVKKIDEKKIALEMDYIKSEPFIYEGMNETEREKSLNIMANLQCMVNAVDASFFNLPEYSKCIADEIKRTPYLTERIKNKALELLIHLDARKKSLCHCDLHPSNILFDGKKHWIIDWDSASTGDPAADACMTYFFEKRYAPNTADKYLHAYCKNSIVKQEEIFVWLPVIAAYQVNIKTKEDRDFILSVIDEWSI